MRREIGIPAFRLDALVGHLRRQALGNRDDALGMADENVAVYENYAGNRRNPSKPPKDVGWGEASTDEMCIAYIRVTVDAERLNHRPR